MRISALSSNNKPSFGTTISLSKSVQKFMTPFDHYEVALLREKIINDGRGFDLKIYRYDNNMVGQITPASKQKPISSNIFPPIGVNAENYHKIPKVIQGIFTTAEKIMDAAKNLRKMTIKN